jgi:predicted nucleic acid-binding protein
VILLDTGPLVALCDASDSSHAAARKDLKSILPDEFAVCDAVLSEACFHMPQPYERTRLRIVLNQLNAQPVSAPHEREFRDEVFDWLAKYADHRPDWADACLAVLSGRDPAARVWTYDSEFRTTWRRPNGTAIPLAVRMRQRS